MRITKKVLTESRNREISTRLTLRHLFYFHPCPLLDLLFSFYVDQLSLIELEGLSNKQAVLELHEAKTYFMKQFAFMGISV